MNELGVLNSLIVGAGLKLLLFELILELLAFTGEGTGLGATGFPLVDWYNELEIGNEILREK